MRGGKIFQLRAAPLREGKYLRRGKAFELSLPGNGRSGKVFAARESFRAEAPRMQHQMIKAADGLKCTLFKPARRMSFGAAKMDRSFSTSRPAILIPTPGLSSGSSRITGSTSSIAKKMVIYMRSG